MAYSVRIRPGFLLAASLCTMLAGAGCGNRIIPTGPPGNPSSAAVIVESFTGTLPVNGVRFFSFTNPQDGLISLTLVKLDEDGAGSSALISVGLGVPRGTGCNLVDTRNVGVDVKPQFTDFFPQGVFCARVADLGNLTTDAEFAVNIVHPR
jgi:hypothetical protein